MFYSIIKTFYKFCVLCYLKLKRYTIIVFYVIYNLSVVRFMRELFF